MVPIEDKIGDAEQETNGCNIAEVGNAVVMQRVCAKGAERHSANRQHCRQYLIEVVFWDKGEGNVVISAEQQRPGDGSQDGFSLR